MKRGRGQALLELALCAPIVVLLALGTVATVRFAGTRAGLEAATQAAADAAARAPNPTAAVTEAQARFHSMVVAYPLESATLKLDVGDFERAGPITASSSARVRLDWSALLLLAGEVTIRDQVVVVLERWRTHTAQS